MYLSKLISFLCSCFSVVWWRYST